MSLQLNTNKSIRILTFDVEEQDPYTYLYFSSQCNGLGWVEYTFLYEYLKMLIYCYLIWLYENLSGFKFNLFLDLILIAIAKNNDSFKYLNQTKLEENIGCCLTNKKLGL